MINSLLKKLNSQTISMQKIRLEMTVYLQILLQSYPQLSIYLPQVNRVFRNKGLCTIFGRIQTLIKTKKYKIKMYLHDICPLFMRLLLFTFIMGIDQMNFLEEHLWGTASVIKKNICLTKDSNKNIIGDSITASIQKIISKNIS